METMTDSELLDRIVERAVEDRRFVREVTPNDLRPVEEYDTKTDSLLISEGQSSKYLHRQIINCVSLALDDPRWFFETLRDEAPNNGDALLDLLGQGIVNSPNPQVKGMTTRTLGLVQGLGDIMREVEDGREENYTYRLYNSLARSTTKLNVGTNPIGRTKEFYIDGPVHITKPADDPDAGEDQVDAEVSSAAEW